MTIKFPTSEGDWDYNGPFSYSTEYHMATIGGVIGFLLGWSHRIRNEFSEKPHYLLGALIFGSLFGYYIDKRGK